MGTNCQFTTLVHTLALLACAQEPVSSTSIAGSVNTNPVVIRKLIGRLREAGLVKTFPGSAGGAVLARDPAAITVAEVYNLVRNETFFGLHPSEPNPCCPVGRNIQDVLIEICTELDALVAGTLAEITISDILHRVCQREDSNLLSL